MFIDNKYTKIYNLIIARSFTRELYGYSEKHHIIPKCLGGNNLKENIAILSAREHFICHWLLTKMLIGVAKAKMYHALNLMLHAENPYQAHKRYKFTSRVYEIFKKKYAKILSLRALKNNPMHDPKTREKHAAAIKQRGPTVGNSGNTASDITKAKMRSAQLGKTLTPATKEKLSLININRDYRPGNTGLVSWYNPVTKMKKFFLKDAEPDGDWVKGSIPQTKVTCPHCGKNGSKAPMSKWHFDKCKEKFK